MKHLPNIVTIIRILCSPLIVILLIASANSTQFMPNGLNWAFWIYVLAASTDWVDGTLARALNAKSALGAKLDLWADKLLVGLVIFAIIVANILYRPQDFFHITLVGIFLLASTSLRDYLVTEIRAKGEKIGVSMPATFLAKTKTAVIMAGIGVYLFALAYEQHSIMLLGWTIIIIGALMSLYTGWQYYSAYLGAKNNQGGGK